MFPARSAHHPRIVGVLQDLGHHTAPRAIAQSERHFEHLGHAGPAARERERICFPVSLLQRVFDESLHTRVCAHRELIDVGIHPVLDTVTGPGRAPRLPRKHDVCNRIGFAGRGRIAAHELHTARLEDEAKLSV
jgi:hypothetical protein